MIERSLNRTNVIWSFNSLGLNENLIDHISNSSVDAIRLVGLGKDIDSIIKNGEALKEQFSAKGKVAPILVDVLRAARCYVSNLTDEMNLVGDEVIRITPCGGGGDLEFNCSDWDLFFQDEALVYLGHGVVTLMPEAIEKAQIKARVIQGGRIAPNVEAHCPTSRPSAFLTPTFLEEVRAVGQLPIDGLVVPGLKDVEEMERLKNELNELTSSPPWLFLRVDTEETYLKIKDFVPFIKGVLVSRLDLGMSMDPAKVPMVTKEIIQICNDHAKIVIIASDILGSMRHNATPTRAEVSDIANAAIDGADGVVLSEDLALGEYSARGLQLAKKTIHEIENRHGRHNLNWVKRSPEVNYTLAAVTYSAYRTAHRNNAKAIVCLTTKGNTALLLASFRTDIPIFAVTLSEDVLRRVTMIRGVHGILLEDAPNIDEVLPMINNYIVKDTWLQSGDKIVFVSVSLSSVGEKASNLFTVQTLQ